MSKQKSLLRSKAMSLIVLVLVFLIATTLFGCSGNNETQDNSTETESNQIIDMAGRKIKLPDEIKTIATPNVDAYRIILQLGAQDMLVGVPSNMYGSKFSQADTIEVLSWPRVKELEKVGGGPPGTEVNAEVLVKLKPDVIISWNFGENANEMADKLQEQTHIPVVCLNTIDAGGANMEGIESAYTLVGKLTGKGKNAEDLISYYKKTVDEIQTKLENSGEKSKKVYMGGPNSILTKSRGYLPLKQLKLNNVASELTGESKEISKEQLLEWNPELIFLHTPSKVKRVNMEELKADPVLSNMQAVKNDTIYSIKAMYMGWDIATGLVDLNYMAKLAYPETFKDLDVSKKSNEILKKFYRTDGLYQVLEENNGLHKFDN